MIICCFPINADGSDPLAYGVASAVAVVLIVFACIIIAVAIGVSWKKRQSRQIDDFEHELPAIATAATNLARSDDVERETQHEPIQSRQVNAMCYTCDECNDMTLLRCLTEPYEGVKGPYRAVILHYIDFKHKCCQ